MEHYPYVHLYTRRPEVAEKNIWESLFSGFAQAALRENSFIPSFYPQVDYPIHRMDGTNYLHIRLEVLRAIPEEQISALQAQFYYQGYMAYQASGFGRLTEQASFKFLNAIYTETLLQSNIVLTPLVARYVLGEVGGKLEQPQEYPSLTLRP